MIATAVLRARRAGELAGGSSPTASERDLIARAIENSDNAAAASLFSELGPTAPATDALQRVVDVAGDRATKVNAAQTRPPFSTYGQTRWPLADGARFYRALADGCLLRPEDTKLILGDMARVTPVGGSGWGLPQAGFSDLRFKAGWGPEQGYGSYTALQYGIVGTAQSHGYVIGVVAETDADAETAYGIVTRVAERAARQLKVETAPAGQPAC